MISASNDSQQQEQLIEKYMSLPNQVWDDIINQAAKNVDVLKDHEAVKQLGSILKTNVRACKALVTASCCSWAGSTWTCSMSTK